MAQKYIKAGNTEVQVKRQLESTIFYHKDQKTPQNLVVFFLLKGILNNFIQPNKRNFKFIKIVSGNLTISDTILKNANQSLKRTYMIFPVFLCGLQMQE